MTSLSVSGSKDSVNVFFDEILNLSNNGVFIETKGKEHLNTDGTIRKRIKVDISSLRGSIKDSKGTFIVSLGVVSDSKDELNQFLEILKKLAVVYYIPREKRTKLQITCINHINHKKYGAYISCIDKKSAAKNKLLGMGDDRFKLLK